MGYEVIDRHTQLVHFLSQFWAYKDKDDKPVFKTRAKFVSGYKMEEFSFLQVHRAADVICDLFNLSAPVVEGKFDLYRLFQAYFLDEYTRKEINKVIGAK